MHPWVCVGHVEQVNEVVGLGVEQALAFNVDIPGLLHLPVELDLVGVPLVLDVPLGVKSARTGFGVSALLSEEVLEEGFHSFPLEPVLLWSSMLQIGGTRLV